MWRDRSSLAFTAEAEKTPRQIILKAVLLNLLNPKLTLFFFAFLPLSLSPAARFPLAELLTLSFVFMALTLIVFGIYGVLASGVRAYVVNSPKVMLWLKRGFALSFVALGLRLAVAER